MAGTADADTGTDGTDADDAAAGGYPDHGLYTIPNLITLLRLCSLPVFLWLLFGQKDRFGAALLLSVLGATDWCDGYIARNFNQTSNFGKLFDPTADRILFFVAIGGIIVDGSAPLWFCWIILVREVVVAAITVTLVALGAKPVDVTWFGKAGTFCLMFAFPLWLGGASTVSVAPAFTTAGWLFALPGITLSFYAAFRYVPVWGAALRDARLAKAG